MSQSKDISVCYLGDNTELSEAIRSSMRIELGVMLDESPEVNVSHISTNDFNKVESLLAGNPAALNRRQAVFVECQLESIGKLYQVLDNLEEIPKEFQDLIIVLVFQKIDEFSDARSILIQAMPANGFRQLPWEQKESGPQIGDMRNILGEITKAHDPVDSLYE